MVYYLQKGLKYLGFLLTANSKYGIHSPFVYNLVTKVFEDERYYYGFDTIQKLRKELLMNNEKIKIKDHGRGSRVNKSLTRKVSDIARSSSVSHKYGQLLFRLVHNRQPDVILELGTSLGIGTSYLALAKPAAKVVTLEGCPNTAQLALENFKEIGASNVELIEGAFKKTLPQQLEKLSKVDLVFFDGDHRKKPTIDYFEQCLEKAHNDSVFVFDDIRHSGEMEAAWQYIMEHPQVQVSIDIFQVGLVFFRQQQTPQHFKIRF